MESKFKIGDKVVYWSKEDSRVYEILNFDWFGWLIVWSHGVYQMEKPPFSEIRHATEKEVDIDRRVDYN